MSDTRNHTTRVQGRDGWGRMVTYCLTCTTESRRPGFRACIQQAHVLPPAVEQPR